MVTKKKLLKLYTSYHASMPARDLKTVEALAELNASLGHEHLELFICEKQSEKIITALRKKGFMVQYLKWKANNNWKLVGISWTHSDFI